MITTLSVSSNKAVSAELIALVAIFGLATGTAKADPTAPTGRSVIQMHRFKPRARVALPPVQNSESAPTTVNADASSSEGPSLPQVKIDCAETVVRDGQPFPACVVTATSDSQNLLTREALAERVEVLQQIAAQPESEQVSPDASITDADRIQNEKIKALMDSLVEVRAQSARSERMAQQANAQLQSLHTVISRKDAYATLRYGTMAVIAFSIWWLGPQEAYKAVMKWGPVLYFKITGQEYPSKGFWAWAFYVPALKNVALDAADFVEQSANPWNGFVFAGVGSAAVGAAFGVPPLVFWIFDGIKQAAYSVGQSASYVGRKIFGKERTADANANSGVNQSVPTPPPVAAVQPTR